MPTKKSKTNPKPTRSRKTPPAQTKPRARKPSAAPSRDAQIQNTLYRIADAASAVTDMQEFYATLHRIVGELMYAENFAVILYDQATGIRQSAYLVDTTDEVSLPPAPMSPKSGMALIQRTGRAYHLNRREQEKRAQRGQWTGTFSEDAIAVPLITGGEFLGILIVQNYTEDFRYAEQDVQILEFVAQHIATALARARAIEETRQRAAELQIINSIQQGLAAELDFQTIVDLVGNNLRAVFNTPNLAINWYNEKTKLLHALYAYEHGQRISVEPYAPTPDGQFETQVQTRQPIVLNSFQEIERMGALALPGTDQCKSSIAVPVISSDRVLGNIVIENFERENAFGESEVRLLTTIAASLGTALENARLFDETQRLFQAEQQRATELAMINSVQEGLASQLEFQAIVDLVGDKIQQIFDSQVVSIVLFDPQTNIVTEVYAVERGERVPLDPPHPKRDTKLGRNLELSRQPIRLNTAAEFEEYGLYVVEGTENAKSLLITGMFVGDVPRGTISLQNLDHANAFTDADARLLQTLASSLAVALENARLFDAEKQRAAELEIINSVQAALASKLDMQSIYEVVGDKIQEIFDAQAVSITSYDTAQEMAFPHYGIEKGERYFDEPYPYGTSR